MAEAPAPVVDHVVVNCECHDLLHNVRISDWDGDAFLIEVVGTPGPWWRRLKFLIKYLFKLDSVIVADVIVPNDKAADIVKLLTRSV